MSLCAFSNGFFADYSEGTLLSFEKLMLSNCGFSSQFHRRIRTLHSHLSTIFEIQAIFLG